MANKPLFPRFIWLAILFFLVVDALVAIDKTSSLESLQRSVRSKSFLSSSDVSLSASMMPMNRTTTTILTEYFLATSTEVQAFEAGVESPLASSSYPSSFLSSSSSSSSDSVSTSASPRKITTITTERGQRFKTLTRTTTSFAGSVSASVTPRNTETTFLTATTTSWEKFDAWAWTICVSASIHDQKGNGAAPTAAPTAASATPDDDGYMDAVAYGTNGCGAGQALETGTQDEASFADSGLPGVPVPVPLSIPNVPLSIPGVSFPTAAPAPGNAPANGDTGNAPGEGAQRLSDTPNTPGERVQRLRKTSKSHKPHTKPHNHHPSTSNTRPIPTGPPPTGTHHRTLTTTLTPPPASIVVITTTYIPLPATFTPHLNLDPVATSLLHALALPSSPSGIVSLFHPPRNQLLNCYHTGRWESRTDMVKSITSFCRYLRREAFSPNHLPHSPDRNISYPLTGYRKHEFNFVDMGFIFPYTHVLVSLEVKPGCEWEFDQYECETYLRIPVDQCQRDTGEQFKKGGTVQGRTHYGDFYLGPHVHEMGPPGTQGPGGWERGGFAGPEEVKEWEEKKKGEGWEWGVTQVQDGMWESGWRGDKYLEEHGEEKPGDLEKMGLSRTCLVWRIDAESGKVYPHENAEKLDWKEPKTTTASVRYYSFGGGK